MRGRYVILFFLTIFLLNCGYTSKQLRHIKYFENFTGFTFPKGAKIVRSGYSEFIDHTYHMVIKTDQEYIDSIIDLKAPFSDEWGEGPIPDDGLVLLDFGTNMKMVNDEETEAFLDGPLMDLVKSEDLFYSYSSDSITHEYSDIIIIDTKTNTIYVGSFSSRL